MIGGSLIDVLRRPEVVTLQRLGANELTVRELELGCRCLKLGVCFGEPDFVGNRVDGEEEMAFMDDISVLEMYFRECAADLCAQFDLVNR